MPGPGQYEIKSQFSRSQSPDDEDPDASENVAPFGSRLQVIKQKPDVFYCYAVVKITHVSAIHSHTEVPDSQACLSFMYYIPTPSY